MYTYIFIFDVANCVTGGLIYPRNKIRYLNSIGADVKVIPTNSGKIYIDGLEEYKSDKFVFFHEYPGFFTKKQINAFLNIILEYIGPCSKEIYIETGTDYTSYWGELIAKRLRAVHLTVFLDEKNERLYENTKQYWQFKYDRGELICITDEAMKQNFSHLINLHSGTRFFNCYCGNSIENTQDNGKFELPLSDINIGYFGRTDKEVLYKSIEGINRFASNINCLNLKISFIVFGGPQDKEARIREILNPGIALFVTGYLFPLQLSVAKKMDIFISTAGSASALGNCGILTIRMDMYEFKPVGIIKDVDKEEYELCPIGNRLEDYLKWIILEKGNVTVTEHSLDVQWNKYCAEYERQIKYIAELDEVKEYFSTDHFKAVAKNKKIKVILKTILIRTFGFDGFIKLRNLVNNKVKINEQ